MKITLVVLALNEIDSIPIIMPQINMLLLRISLNS
jgi:hypothetical protein